MWKALSINRFSLLTASLLGATWVSSAQPDTEPEDEPGAADAHRFGVFHLVKLFPSFSGFDLVGGGVAYETGAGVFPFSVNASARYYHGSDSIGPQVPEVARHMRFEVQARWWPIQTFRAFFAGVLVNAYSTGGFSAGGIVGYHVFVSKRIVAEVSIGFQTRNASHFPEFPILLRYGVGVGAIFPKMQRYGY
jgi:hypothetical protein